jgi:peptidoglycan DL-endopeptidase CwlO
MSHRTVRVLRSRLRRRTAAVVLTSGLALGVTATAVPAGPVAAAPTPPAANVIGLAKGARGEHVKALQTALNRVGIGVKYGVDGYFGSATQASVKAFQNYKHLPITGVVDAATAAALGFGTQSAPRAKATAQQAPAAAPAAAPTANATSMAGLQLGSSGPAVAQAQQAITRIGWPVAADGVFGARTQAAVTSIQRANGLPATGAIDERTARLLERPAAAATPAAPAITVPTPATPAPALTPTTQPLAPTTTVAAPVVDPPPPVSPRAGTAVAAALGQLGVPYVAFAQTPGVGFDCSGLTAFAWAQAGVSLAHQSSMQFAALPHIAKEAAQPGDLLFYHSPIHHVTIYVGNSRQIQAPSAGSVVQVATVNWNNVVGVGRPG